MSRLLCWVLLALCYGLTGCYGEVWRVDSRFTPEERTELDKAAETWEAAGQSFILAHGHKLTGRETQGRYIIRAGEREAHYYSPSFESPSTAAVHGQAPLGAERIVVVPERMAGKLTPFWQVVAHEMGHSFGIDHVDDERAIMYHTGTQNSLRCLTSVDIFALCSAVECSTIPKGCDE